MTPDPELEALLDGIWMRRRGELLDRVGHLASCLDRMHAEPTAWAEVGAEAHRLTGALGSLGFDELARAAAGLERSVAAAPDAPPDVAAVRAVVDRLDASLRAAASRPAPG